MKWSSLNDFKFMRYHHTANLIGNFIYLFGGSHYHYYYNDLYKYDVKSKTLQKAITRGNIPNGRYQHGSAVIEEKLYIFGGYGNYDTRRDNNLYSLNTISSEWVAIPIAESSVSFPQPR